MKTDNFLKSEFGFEQPMGITRHIEWLEHCGTDHLMKKYNLTMSSTEEQFALAKWKEHKEYWGYLSMPLCFEGESPSIGEKAVNLN